MDKKNEDYKYIGPVKCGLRRVKRDGKYCYIKSDGSDLSSERHGLAGDFYKNLLSRDRVWVRRDGREGFVNTDGSKL